MEHANITRSTHPAAAVVVCGNPPAPLPPLGLASSSVARLFNTICSGWDVEVLGANTGRHPPAHPHPHTCTPTDCTHTLHTHTYIPKRHKLTMPHPHLHTCTPTPTYLKDISSHCHTHTCTPAHPHTAHLHTHTPAHRHTAHPHLHT